MKDFGMKNAIFEPDELWFDSHIPIWQEVLGHLKDQPIKYLEIGSYKGRSACWMLKNILGHSDAKMVSIDPFTGSAEHIYANGGEPLDYYDIFRHNIKQTRQSRKVKVMKGYSQDILIKLLNKKNIEKFDLIYIDGSHTAYDTLTDAILSLRLLKRGGIMIFDDYPWKEPHGRLHHEPKLGIHAFCSSFQDFVESIHTGWQVILRKTQ